MIGLLLKLIPGFSTTVALTQLAVGVVYPTFKSFEAIESRHTAKDDTQWLTYWVVYSFLNLLEKFLWVVLMWIPLYSLLKTALLAWLVAPQFCGAKVLYTMFIRNAISTVANQLKDIPAFEDIVTPFLESQAAALQKKNDDVGKTAPPNDEQSVMGAGAQ